MAGEENPDGSSPANWLTHAPKKASDAAAIMALKLKTAQNHLTVTVNTNVLTTNPAACDALPQMSAGTPFDYASHATVQNVIFTMAK